MGVWQAYGPAPVDEVGNTLAVEAIWETEAGSELTFFQGECECELVQVESGERDEGQAAGEQHCTHDQTDAVGVRINVRRCQRRIIRGLLTLL